MTLATPADPSVRLRLDIAYDGAAFHGWAAQAGLRTVQGVLEEWIAKVLRLPGAAELTCAGRTDSGVHARGQVAHVDIDPSQATIPDGFDLAPHLHYKLNRALPPDVIIRSVTEAPAGFDARFSAQWRRYVYRICDTIPDPLTRGSIATYRHPIDVERFNQAANTLLGLHDFAAFCKRRDGATTIRTLLELHANRDSQEVICVTVKADAFCHSQVRSLVGALTTVASGQRDEAWLATLLNRKERSGDVLVMPGHGLCLEEVSYPANDQLAARAVTARSVRTLEET